MEQYDTPAYRRYCSALADPVAELIALDLKEPGAEAVLIGVDGSPTMGVRFASSGADWGGQPDKLGDFDSDIVSGKGIFVEILLDKLSARGIALVADGAADRTRLGRPAIAQWMVGVAGC